MGLFKRKSNSKVILYRKKINQEEQKKIKKMRNYVKSIALIKTSKCVGCTYISEAIREFLSSSFVIQTEEEQKKFINNYPNEHQIYDLGDYYQDWSDWKELELKRADKKFCVANYPDTKEAFEELKEIAFDEDICFLFNLIPKEKEKEIYDLMEEYNICFIPVFYNKKLDKKTKKLFEELL